MRQKQKNSEDTITKLQVKLTESENLASDLENKLLEHKQKHNQKQAHIEEKHTKTKYVITINRLLILVVVLYFREQSSKRRAHLVSQVDIVNGELLLTQSQLSHELQWNEKASSLHQQVLQEKTQLHAQ